MADGNEYYQEKKSMISTKTNRRLGGATVIETVREGFSNKMTFKQDLEQVTTVWQYVCRRGVQGEERLATEELHSVVLKAQPSIRPDSLYINTFCKSRAMIL